ncbi:MAG TPA: cytochrome c [Acidimicrobiia bacterium]|nr:cytochrome c [Acidimicrobiia bacterium]
MRNMKVAVLIAVLALVLAACGGGDEGGDGGSTTTPGAVGAGNPVAGASVYSGTCSACHAPDLSGIDGLGKPLAPSAFVESNSEEDLVAFLKVGRPASDPLNTQGVDMPPKGGNPSLTDQDLADVSAYLKAQQ